TAEAAITCHGFSRVITDRSVLTREDPWPVFIINDFACRSYFASASGACRRRHSSARGTLNPVAANQTPHRRVLPSSPSPEPPGNARNGRSVSATTRAPRDDDQSARRSRRGCTTQAAGYDSHVRSSALRHHFLTPP